MIETPTDPAGERTTGEAGIVRAPHEAGPEQTGHRPGELPEDEAALESVSGGSRLTHVGRLFGSTKIV